MNSSWLNFIKYFTITITVLLSVTECGTAATYPDLDDPPLIAVDFPTQPPDTSIIDSIGINPTESLQGGVLHNAGSGTKIEDLTIEQVTDVYNYGQTVTLRIEVGYQNNQGASPSKIFTWIYPNPNGSGQLSFDKEIIGTFKKYDNKYIYIFETSWHFFSPLDSPKGNWMIRAIINGQTAAWPFELLESFKPIVDRYYNYRIYKKGMNGQPIFTNQFHPEDVIVVSADYNFINSRPTDTWCTWIEPPDSNGSRPRHHEYKKVDNYQGTLTFEWIVDDLYGEYDVVMTHFWWDRTFFSFNVNERNNHTISASVVGGGGNIYPSGEISVYDGTDQQFSFTPINGYVLDFILVNGNKQNVTDSNTLILPNITQDYTVEAYYKIDDTQACDSISKVKFTIPQTESEIQESSVVMSSIRNPFTNSLGISLSIKFPCYTNPVDIYVALQKPDDSLEFIIADGSTTLEFKAIAVQDTYPIELSTVLYNYPAGSYWVYWAVAPTNGGDLSRINWNGPSELGYYNRTIGF